MVKCWTKVQEKLIPNKGNVYVKIHVSIWRKHDFKLVRKRTDICSFRRYRLQYALAQIYWKKRMINGEIWKIWWDVENEKKKVNISWWNGFHYISVIRHSGDSQSLFYTRVAGFRWKWLNVFRWFKVMGPLPIFSKQPEIESRLKWLIYFCVIWHELKNCGNNT